MCDRTIRDYDIRVDVELPNDWLIAAHDKIQPTGGFHSKDAVRDAKGSSELHMNASTLHPAVGGRLLPGMAADISRNLLLVPEGAGFTDIVARLRWAAYLDDSPPSQGEIDVARMFGELRSRS